MKPSSTPVPPRRRTKVAAATRPRAPSSYVSVAETKALLAASQEWRQARLNADDMLSTEEAAVLAGTSRVTINAWIAKGRAIGLSQTRRGYRLPRWQFEPALWELLPALSKALGVTGGWAILSFLETPLGGLEGVTPRQAIEQGRSERVLELADSAFLQQ
ncbi:hypothetical protein [Mitsuaria sp. 7]|uniref:hypothetical protein n=1 Tax=Mitsuaria sp. 7 TaxID=1658665 RepID=UPI0012F7AC87|nr:hypothetical protein [Mitsuaria sp. 7]